MSKPQDPRDLGTLSLLLAGKRRIEADTDVTSAGVTAMKQRAA